MYEVVAEDFEVAPTSMSADVSVTRRIFDRAVVSFAGVGFVFFVDAVLEIFRYETEINEIGVVLFGASVAE